MNFCFSSFFGGFSRPFAVKKCSSVLFLFIKGIRDFIHLSRYRSFSILIVSRFIASSVIKNDRQNLSFVFLMYFGLHFLRPCVFLLRIPSILEIHVTIKRTVQRRQDFAIIKRSMSESLFSSPIVRELQRAIRRTCGKIQNNQSAIRWRVPGT